MRRILPILLCSIAIQAQAQTVTFFPQVDSLSLWGTCTPPGFICGLNGRGSGIGTVVIRPRAAELVVGTPPYHITARYDSAYFQISDSVHANRYEIWFANQSRYYPARFRVPFDSVVLALPGPCDLTLRVICDSSVVDSSIFRFTSFQTGLGMKPDHVQMPRGEHLLQIYPNPFNPSTRMRFVLTTPGWATLRVFNLLGQEVSVLVNDGLPVGEHAVSWDARSFPGGVYFCRLQSGSLSEVRKLILGK